MTPDPKTAAKIRDARRAGFSLNRIAKLCHVGRSQVYAVLNMEHRESERRPRARITETPLPSRGKICVGERLRHLWTDGVCRLCGATK